MAELTVTPANVLQSTDAVRESGTFGATITAGMAVYKDAGASNKLKGANSGASASSVVVGIALNGGADGQPGHYQSSGQINLGATLNKGTIYALSDSVPGGIFPMADLPGDSYVTVIGVALSTSILELQIFNSGITLVA